MAVPTIDIFSPGDGAEVDLVFSTHGHVKPSDANMSAWVTDANGHRTDGTASSVAGATWAFNVTVLQAGPYTLTIQAVDNAAAPPETATRFRPIVVRVPPGGGGIT